MNRPGIDQQITFLFTPDLDVTAGFYGEILGLPIILDQGSCRIFQVGDGAYLGFCHHMKRANQPEGIILTLVTSEVNAWFEFLLQQGIMIEKRPAMNVDFNIYHFFVHDPNGYLIEFQRFNDPLWPNKA